MEKDLSVILGSPMSAFTQWVAEVKKKKANILGSRRRGAERDSGIMA